MVLKNDKRAERSNQHSIHHRFNELGHHQIEDHRQREENQKNAEGLLQHADVAAVGVPCVGWTGISGGWNVKCSLTTTVLDHTVEYDSRSGDLLEISP